MTAEDICWTTAAARVVFVLCLAVALSVPIICSGADPKEGGGAWITTAVIIRNGGQYT